MRLVAHRLPDSPAAIEALSAAGANVFELDVQLWRGHLVVSHYLPVVRPISRWRRDGLRLLWVREGHGVGYATALGTIPQDAELVLDLKDDRGQAAWLLAERLLSQEVDRSRCVVASKHWETLGWLASHGFRTWRSVATQRALATLLREGPDPRFTGVSVRHTYLTPSVLERLQPFGEVVAWTVRSPSRAHELVGLGVGGIVADAPAVLAAARD